MKKSFEITPNRFMLWRTSWSQYDRFCFPPQNACWGWMWPPESDTVQCLRITQVSSTISVPIHLNPLTGFHLWINFIKTSLFASVRNSKWPGVRNIFSSLILIYNPLLRRRSVQVCFPNTINTFYLYYSKDH